MKLLDSLGTINTNHEVTIPNDTVIKISIIAIIIFASFFLLKKFA